MISIISLIFFKVSQGFCDSYGVFCNYVVQRSCIRSDRGQHILTNQFTWIFYAFILSPTHLQCPLLSHLLVWRSAHLRLFQYMDSKTLSQLFNSLYYSYDTSTKFCLVLHDYGVYIFLIVNHFLNTFFSYF